MTQNSAPSLTYSKPVILVGGGTFNPTQLDLFSNLNYPIIAADGGANALKSTGIIPDAIIGDLDSLDDIAHWQNITKIHHDSDQNTTDFEKCLEKISAPLFLCLGFWGDELGHSLACLHILAKFHETKNAIIFTESELMFATARAIRLNLAPQIPVSIYPLQSVRFKGSTGLAFPLDNLDLDQGNFIGTSNQTSQSTVTVTPSKENQSAYITIIPVSFWQEAASALEGDI